MRYKGKITSWNSDRGFGFVTPTDGGAPVFVHITAIADRSRPLPAGAMVTYELAIDEKNRPRAVRVRRSMPTRLKSHAASPSASSPIPLIVASLFVLLVVAATLARRLPQAVLLTYGFGSILTFLVYWYDKSAARNSQWRTKESSLLFLGLAGGWPGAIVAQRMLRHKSRKRTFQAAFWGTVVMNLIALGWLLTNSGSKLLEQLLK